MKTIYSSASRELHRINRPSNISWDARARAICLGFPWLLLLTPRAGAEVRGLQLGGKIATSGDLAHPRLQLVCDSTCMAAADLTVESGKTSATLNCPDCVVKGDNGQILASTHASATANRSESVSGATKTVTFTASGNARVVFPPPEIISSGTLQADAVTSAMGGFTVVDKTETVTLTKSISGSGSGSGDLSLIGPSGKVVGSYVIEFESGLVFRDTFPPILSLAPGAYNLSLSVSAHARINLPSRQNSPTNANFQVSLSFTAPREAEYHWKNPDGGNFGTASNWDLQKVPGSGATTVFDLTGGNLNSVPIQPANNAVGELFIRGMPVRFTGPLRVTAVNPAQFGFVVEDGGSLVLDSGAIFQTQGASIGSGGAAESSVLVSGASTKWTSSSFAPLVIGPPGRGRVVVDHNATLDAQKQITLGGVGLGVGTLRIDNGGRVQTPKCAVNKGAIQVVGFGTQDSQLEIAADLEIGSDRGPGTLLIENGGTVTAQRVFVGDNAGNGGETVTISSDSSGTHISLLQAKGASAFLQVAGGSGAQIEVKNGGVLSVGNLGGEGRIGHLFDVGKVIVRGQAASHRSNWSMLGDLFIGSQIVPSELVVEDGALVTVANAGTSQMSLGLGPGELGRATISGTGSLLDTDALKVGNNGRGELMISGGAHVQSRRASVGKRFTENQSPGSGSVTIEGTPLISSSEWHVLGDCLVGFDEPGQIKLSGLLGGGATLTVDGTLEIGMQGSVIGNGTLAVPTANRLVLNGGFISPGLSPGLIVINGNFEQTPNGALRIEVAGVDPGKFDVIQINGAATLAGRVELSFTQGFVPRLGDKVEFLQINGKASGGLEVVPLLVPDDPAAGRPAMAVQASWALSADGKGSLTVTGVRPTVQLHAALGPLVVGQERQLTLSFVPIAGQNHLIEFRDGFGAGSIWQPLPGGPRNSGILSDTSTTPARFYRVRLGN